MKDHVHKGTGSVELDSDAPVVSASISTWLASARGACAQRRRSPQPRRRRSPNASRPPGGAELLHAARTTSLAIGVQVGGEQHRDRGAGGGPDRG
jgi:hypothetical protein